MASSTNGAEGTAKGMSCWVAEMQEGKVVMVQKALGEGTRGSLDDFRSSDNRVNPGAQSADVRTAPTTVVAAAAAGDVDTLRQRLAEEGSDPNQAMPRVRTTALMLAAHKGHADCVKVLLDAGADPLKQDNIGELSALMLACSVAGPEHTKAAELLLAAGGQAAVEQRDCDGRTGLLYAGRSGHIAAVRAVFATVSAAAVVNVCDDSGTSPVAAAAANGHTATLEFLLAHKGDPRLADEMGCTPLHMAVISSHCAAITVLLAAGASPDTPDDDGVTPAAEAADIGDPDILAALGLSPQDPHC
jgi:ankyrin repeat protein